MTSSSSREARKVLLGVVLYPGFEPLDVCGPVNLFAASGQVDVIYIAQEAGPVTSVTGKMTWLANHSFADILAAAAAGAILSPDAADSEASSQQQQQQQQQSQLKLDWLLIPGGVGSRKEVTNSQLLQLVQRLCAPSYGLQLCMSVCTGAAILAAAGVLDGKKATSNKNVFSWVTSVRQEVQWVQKARWVTDGMFATSSGVTAGADMAVYVMKQQFGADVAAASAKYNEYMPCTVSEDDPFADDSFVPEV